MSIVMGTSAGFVTASPAADPDGALSRQVQNWSRAIKDTTSADSNITVTEIGWYKNNATTNADNYEVGIYDHDSGNDIPQDIVGSDTTNTLQDAIGWQVVTGLNIALSSSTIYWIAVQCDYTSGTIGSTDRDDLGAPTRYAYRETTTSLADPWTNDGEIVATLAFYAKYTSDAGETGLQINVGYVWKDVTKLEVNIGNVWKTVTKLEVNIGNVWKTVF